MFLKEFNEILEKISDSQLSITNEFINRSLESVDMNKPFMFSPELVDSWKNHLEQNTNYISNNIELLNNLFRLYHYTSMKSLGFESAPVAVPERSDRRFFDESWNEHAAFDHIKQFYLLVNDLKTR